MFSFLYISCSFFCSLFVCSETFPASGEDENFWQFSFGICLALWDVEQRCRVNGHTCTVSWHRRRLPSDKTIGYLTSFLLFQIRPKPDKGCCLKALSSCWCCITLLLLAASGGANNRQVIPTRLKTWRGHRVYTGLHTQNNLSSGFDMCNSLTCKSPLWERRCWDRCARQSRRPSHGPNCICYRSTSHATGCTSCRPLSPLLLKEQKSFFIFFYY
jgi:hypothetical protein